VSSDRGPAIEVDDVVPDVVVTALPRGADTHGVGALIGSLGGTFSYTVPSLDTAVTVIPSSARVNPQREEFSEHVPFALMFIETGEPFRSRLSFIVKE
jgi:hypothetical protein